MDMEELANIIKNHGLDGGNKAIDGFVSKYTSQFKEKFGRYVNK